MLGPVPNGQIIFLNGTSGSGKTSIAEELLVPSDQVVPTVGINAGIGFPS
jgi:chloramphenicol 3-O-phosphotransferase